MTLDNVNVWYYIIGIPKRRRDEYRSISRQASKNLCKDS